MKRRKKILISAMSVLLIMALAATIISFSLADNKNQGDTSEFEMLLAEGDVDTTLSNVDYVIKKTSEEGAQKFRIVEIGSSSASISSWSTFVSSGDFKNYVIDGNRTIEEAMKEGMVEYKYYSAEEVTDDNADALAYISGADMVYVSCNAATPYQGKNDLGEDLYNFLHIYAVGEYKAFIIDDPSSIKLGSGSQASVENFSTFIGSTFLKSGSKYNAAPWPTGMETTKFLNPTLDSASFYKDLSGRTRYEFWTQLQSDNENKPYNMAKFLIISKNGDSYGTSGSVNARLLSDAMVNTAAGMKYADGTDLTLDTNEHLFKLTDSVFWTNGYKSSYVRPDYAHVTEVKLSDIKDDTDLDQYDVVIIETDCSAESVTADASTKFSAAMLGNVKFVYDQGLGTVPSGNNNSQTPTFAGTNYKMLFDMVATAEGVARFSNILVTNATELEVILTSQSAQTCKKLADLINGAAFRGIGGPSSSSTSFTVLEIEPCYPIDTHIANAKKSYYDNPANVLNNMTAEQIEGNNLNNEYSKWSEYYAWELSPAKIADALNMDVKDITVVHMSSEELQANKTDILGTYDLVYFGGNTSALKSIDQYRIIAFNYTATINGLASNMKYMPVYTMYSHNGDYADYRNSYLGQSGNGGLANGTLLGTINGEGKTFALFNGNDISVANREALYDYVLAGMPIMFSDDVTNAYSTCLSAKNVDGNVYLQNSIDPDSNVFKLLSDCYDLSAQYTEKGITNSNIYWGLNAANSVEYTDNDGGRLGDTLTGQVEVLNQTNKAAVLTTYTVSSKRPKLVVTSMPARYNMYDDTTKLESKTLAFKYDVTGSAKYTVNLYIDYDLNSKFTEDEIVGSSNTNSLSVDLTTKEQYGENYFGPVYWQLELVDESNANATVQSKVLTNDICYIKNSDTSKGQVNVLQILPENSFGEFGATTLLFCPVCQRSLGILKYNPYTKDNTALTKAAIYDWHIIDDYQKAHNGMTTGICNGSDTAINIGRHEHTFGIVKYDSTYALPDSGGVVGMDDWDTNFAYEVHNLYNFDLDIVTSRDFEAMDAQVQTDVQTLLASDFEGKAIADLSDTELESLKAKLTTAADTAQEAYESSKAATELAQNELDALIVTMIADAQAANAQYTTDQTWADAFKRLSAKTYYAEEAAKGVDISGYTNFYFDYFTYIAPLDKSNVTPEYFHYNEYREKYSAYVTAKDNELNLKDDYKRKDRAAHYDNWMTGCYSSVIIGPAENFAGDDIKVQHALDTLVSYIRGGGNVLMFHETLCATADKGAYRLTAALRDIMGQDKNHMTADESLYKDKATFDKEVAYNNNNSSSIDYHLDIKDKNGNVVKTIYNYQMTDVSANKVVDVKVQSDVRINPYNNGRNYEPYSYNKSTVTDSTTDNTTRDSLVNVSLVGTEQTAVYDPTKYDGVDQAATAATQKNIDYSGYTVTLYIDTDAYKNNGYGQASYTKTVGADGKVSFELAQTKIESTTIAKNDIYYIPYTSPDEEKYFLTNMSYKTDDTKYYSWKDDIKQYYGSFSPRYLTANAFTDSINLTMSANGQTNAEYSPYPYASLQWGKAAEWSNSANVAATAGTDRASLNNKSVLTLYPFTLSDELYVSGTHASSFALDIENQNMTVLYSLAGGNLGKTESSVYAASPKDGTDSYFIYNFGNVNYCGAGHYEITGEGRKNNDERRLYINIICNSITNLAQADIKVFDYREDTATKNDEIKKVTGKPYHYIYEIPAEDNEPEFSFKVTLDSGTTASSVKVYYDVDGSNTFNLGDHMIAQYGASFQVNTLYKLVNKDNSLQTLTIDPSWLTNGRFIYIVIEVTDSNGKVTKKRIRVEKASQLFNLT